MIAILSKSDTYKKKRTPFIFKKIKIFSFFLLFLTIWGCYFDKKDFEWEVKECCRWGTNLVYYSTQSGGGDIYTILPDGTNSYSLTTNLFYKGKGTYTCGDFYIDTNGNGHYDPQETFTNSDDPNINKDDHCWDLGEDFVDQNGNGIFDSSLAEPFYDENNNSIYDCGEEYEDLNRNGHYDPQEPFEDTNLSGCRDENESYTDENSNGKWDSSLAEPFTEFWTIVRSFSEEDMPFCNNDATELLFLSDSTGYKEIYSMNLSNKKIKRLTSDRKGHSYPVFSPNNSRIAYVFTVHDLTPPYTGKNQIFVMNADGSSQKQLTYDELGVTAPAWSFDGERIAYIRSPDYDGSIWIIDADGKEAPVQVPGVLGAKGPLSWINNDTEIIYWRYEPTGAVIYRTPINGEHDPVPIISTYSDNFNPRVSSDGTSLVFVSNRDGHYELYVSDLNGQFQRRITNTNNKYLVNNPSWCP